ncbi:glycoside hydrolase family 30 protein [Cantharellus anzutake]|uniref:glycoside hydrolase family 30 protein n=1 Tax=Cantharellus anzutake TaxID=1750568 RepID=UPI001906713D|nr:glycoside hydrolase family 30 protein [Cantharellus anzutake]KAF8335813.1 glycoside hydrolase family 30 protein [Cantharellus anzutake]
MLQTLFLSILLTIPARPGDAQSVSCELVVRPLKRHNIGSKIQSVFETTWNQTKLFSYSGPSNLNFGSSSGSATAAINIQENTVYQQMDGFGASLTDSAAYVLKLLKQNDSSSYSSLLSMMFNPKDGANSAGISFIRIPLGSSDLSLSAYSYDDVASQDPNMQSFTLDTLPSIVLEVVCDIQLINPYVKYYFVPWSPPGWMKDSNSLLGGSFQSAFTDAYAKYLFRSIMAWQAKGIPPFYISIQNEPLYNNPTYPTALISANDSAQIAIRLRKLLDGQGFTSVKILGYEDNWDSLDYANSVLSTGSSAYSGVAFHCYAGDPSIMSQMQESWPNTWIYQTECASTTGTDWWSDIKWQTERIWIGSPNYYSRTAAMWSLAGDPSGGPLLPGTNSCGQGCRAMVSIVGSNYTLNQEFYGLAHANKAVLPVDAGGPTGERIQSSITGSNAGSLLATTYRIRRSKAGNPTRYTMVVLNSADSGPNPGPITCDIQFRGKHLTYPFPVGLTT